MDIYCPICGEPWDLDKVWDLDGTDFSRPLDRFKLEGCGVFEEPHNFLPSEDDAAKSALLFDLLDDDIDGIASLMEDLK